MTHEATDRPVREGRVSALGLCDWRLAPAARISNWGYWQAVDPTHDQ